MDLNVKYTQMLGEWAKHTNEILEKCSELYSNHYGCWSKNSPKSPGNRIKLSPDKIKEWLDISGSKLLYAELDGQFIGYTIATIENIKGCGNVAWVTQLVVHEDFRNKGIAKDMLFSIWKFSNYFAWGVLTSSPYAIRALEKATRRRCLPERIIKHKDIIFKFGINYVSYVSEKMYLEVAKSLSRINTKFYSDHTELYKMIHKVTTSDIPWRLGGLLEGWEWFAFTFNDQEQLDLTGYEINEMIKLSDHFTSQAYSRMTLDSGHLWKKHTDHEVDLIIAHCLSGGNREILDFGCGSGRHSIALAKKGYDVTAIDSCKKLIDSGVELSISLKLNINFLHGDCRSHLLGRKYKSAICLYDVIGSYVDSYDNECIVNNLYYHIDTGGLVLISVMNFELTESIAKRHFTLSKQPNMLLDLPASQTMEKTGDVFDPNYFMIDTETGIVYRKEQFAEGDSLPEELIIRDKRYRRSEIFALLEKVGFQILLSSCVSAGKWDVPLEPTDMKAKEILILCQKV